MNQTTPLHDWISPRLAALVREGQRAGFERDAIVAVITDLITAAPYNVTAPGPEPTE